MTGGELSAELIAELEAALTGEPAGDEPPGPVVADGRHWHVELGPAETEILTLVAGGVRLLVAAGDDRAVPASPPVYPHDPARDAAFRAAHAEETRARRLAELDLLAAVLAGQPVDQAGLLACVRALNDVRRVLAAVIGVDEHWRVPDEPTPDEAVFLACGWLLSALVVAAGGPDL